MSSVQWSVLTGKHFFPSLIQSPFHHGLIIVFTLAISMSVIAAVISALRGERFVFQEHSLGDHAGDASLTAGAVPGELAVESEIVR